MEESNQLVPVTVGRTVDMNILRKRPSESLYVGTNFQTPTFIWGSINFTLALPVC